MSDAEPTVPTSRRRLAAVLNEAGDIVRIADAENALGIARTEAAKLLSRWMKQGWLRRVGSGAYAPSRSTRSKASMSSTTPGYLCLPCSIPPISAGVAQPSTGT